MNILKVIQGKYDTCRFSFRKSLEKIYFEILLSQGEQCNNEWGNKHGGSQNLVLHRTKLHIQNKSVIQELLYTDSWIQQNVVFTLQPPTPPHSVPPFQSRGSDSILWGAGHRQTRSYTPQLYWWKSNLQNTIPTLFYVVLYLLKVSQSLNSSKKQGIVVFHGWGGPSTWHQRANC